MVPFDIHVAYVHVKDGKNRPVVILYSEDTAAVVFKITSRYECKSEAMRSQYLKITDWKKAGLVKPSYIDTVRAYKIPAESIKHPPIGSLSKKDAEMLIAALKI